MKLHEIFHLHQGNSFELYHMELSRNSGILFISRTAQNNGVAGMVNPVPGVSPFPAGWISVALGGSVLSSFVQRKPFYTAYHVMALEPKRPLSLREKLFYCMCIQRNAYRYSYGRQANRTLKDIDIPDSVPDWVETADITPVWTGVPHRALPLDMLQWREYRLDQLFHIQYGINLEFSNCTPASSDDKDAVNFVARVSQNNGVVGKVKLIPGKEPQPAGLITCAAGGSVLSTFVQNAPFYSGRDLYLLKEKRPMSLHAKLFCCTMIEANRYRFSYGRQANKTLPSLILKLPSKESGTPDFEKIEAYIKSLPYSDRL